MMTNTKPFFEVFPTLQIKGTLHDKLEQTEVERISATKQRDRLSVYLFSTRLILKEDIRAAEKEIKGQLFPRTDMTVRIFERFQLSSQYTPENLMEIYRESNCWNTAMWNTMPSARRTLHIRNRGGCSLPWRIRCSTGSKNPS